MARSYWLLDAVSCMLLPPGRLDRGAIFSLELDHAAQIGTPK